MDTERFWARVRRDDAAKCWEWTGCRDKKGYGRQRIDGATRLAHRVAWTIENGPIPDGLCVLHRCDNPPCINPAHLFIGTVRDNSRDMMAKGRGRLPAGGAEHFNAKLNTELVERIFSDTRGDTLLAREIGVSSQTVNWVRKHGWGGMKPPSVRRMHGNAVLTVDDVRRIRADTRDCGAISRDVGVSLQTVWRIRKRITWKDVA